MRVTSKVTADNALYYIQQARAKLDNVNEQIASGKNINRPGDDPIATRQLLDLDAKIKEGKQYKSNIVKANLWQSVTNTALNGITDVMKQIKQLNSTITNGSSDATIRQNAVAQYTALKQQLIDLANTRVNDQYVFGGFETRQAPFTSADNNFHGTSDALQVEINRGTTLQLNVTGDDLLLGTNPSYGNVNILNEIDNMINAVNTNNTAAISTASSAINDGAKQINNVQSEVASKMIRLDSMDKLLTNNSNALETILSGIQAVDYAKAATELSQQQMAFEAALSATAKISSLSLLDYLQ